MCFSVSFPSFISRSFVRFIMSGITRNIHVEEPMNDQEKSSGLHIQRGSWKIVDCVGFTLILLTTHWKYLVVTHIHSLLLLNTTQNLRPHNRQFEVVERMNKWMSLRVCLKLYACHIAVSFHLIYLFNRPNWKCESSFDMKINRNLTKTNVKMC